MKRIILGISLLIYSIAIKTITNGGNPGIWSGGDVGVMTPTLRQLVLLTLLLLIFGVTHAATVTAVTNNGSWTTNATWDCNCQPASGDVIIIPVGITLSIPKNLFLYAKEPLVKFELPQYAGFINNLLNIY